MPKKKHKQVSPFEQQIKHALKEHSKSRKQTLQDVDRINRKWQKDVRDIGR
jgi:hypothetical protein